MRDARLLLFVLVVVGCKREEKRDPATIAPAPQVAAPSMSGSGSAGAAIAPRTAPTWYRAVVRGADGVEAYFFLGLPAPGAGGEAIFKVGRDEIRAAATFDGTTLKVPLDVHQTAIDATIGEDGALTGTFSASWRAWGASSLPLVGARVDAPTPGTLATVTGEGPPVELGEPRTAWRVTMTDSGAAKLVVTQTAPGELEGVLSLDTGNNIALAGNGRGDTVVLSGFDGTAAFRLELTLAADRKAARGRLFAGHKFDWREELTATRGPDFVFSPKAKGRKPGAKIGLPDLPELAALPPGPLLVELAGSWCSTCRVAAPFLVELHRTYQPRGLQMVTLLYEFTDDRETDIKQAERFKTTYDVTWPIVPVTGSVDDFLEIMPTGLTDLNPAGFPITLFLDADRALVAVHAGFPPANAKAEARAGHRRVPREHREAARARQVASTS